MSKLINFVKSNIIKILLLLLAILFVWNNKKSSNETKTYLLNTRSKKIHSMDCGVGKRAKEKNKATRTDLLNNIIADGYTVCGDCNAGYRRSVFESIINNVLGPDDIDYDDLALPSRQEYIKAVEEVGEWYVNHIPTYCKVLQEEKATEYIGNDKYIDSCNLKTKGGIFENSKTYNYITNNKTEITVTDNDDVDILKANEKAIYNYKNNYSKIDAKGGILQYPCELIDKNDTYNKAGDDCVRYLFTILNSIDSKFIERIERIASVKWSKINTNKLYNNTSKIVDAMKKNGFIVYDSDNFSHNEDIDIKLISSNFKLEKGDILCRNGHIQIYIGNENTDNFGWGKVSRDFPANYSFDIVRDNSNNSKYTIKMDKGSDVEYYTRVYRYVGGIENEN